MAMTHERCVQFNRFMIEVMGTHTHSTHRTFSYFFFLSFNFGLQGNEIEVPATSPKKFHRLSGPRSNKKKELVPSLFVGYSIK